MKKKDVVATETKVVTTETKDKKYNTNYMWEEFKISNKKRKKLGEKELDLMIVNLDK